MKSLLDLLKTTLVGGILFTLPLILIVLIVDQAIEISDELISPLAQSMPF